MVVEPISLNPFSQYELPFVSSDSMVACEGQPKFTNKELDRLLNEYLVSSKFLGVSLGVFLSGCDDYTGSGGLRNKKHRLKMKTSTSLRIASVTKPMTAIAIMQLFEQELLELDVPIKHYLPYLPKTSVGDITIRQLLGHTSGLRHYSSLWEAMSFTNYGTLSGSLNEFIFDPLNFKSGTRYEYSSYGYTVLGAIIEELSGETYEEYMRANIWGVAGMTNTGLDKLKGDKNSGHYLKLGSLFVRSPHTDLSIIYPAGGVQSTAEDLLKFGGAILENKLISRETLEIMLDVEEPLSVKIGDSPYGLGWTVLDSSKYGRFIVHSGSQPGAESFFTIYLDKPAVIAVLSNAYSSGNEAYLLSRDIANAILKDD